MPNTIHCPSCNRELRVPDELLGKKVKCPACSTTFTASVAGPEAAPQVAPSPAAGEGAALEDQPQPARRPRPMDDELGVADRGEEDYDRPRSPGSRVRSRGLAVMRAPAICLLVSSVVALLGAGLLLLTAVAVSKEQGEAQLKVQQPVRNAQDVEAQKIVVNILYGPGPAVFHLLFIGVNLVIILASIMMLIGKMRWLAVMGSVLAILNIDCICCLLGIPFGIWSLIALNNPDAKSAFQ